jgi:hypothetical protein
MARNRRIGVAIVGAQRSGTTWLARMLDQHPDVCLAKNKEAHLFDSHGTQHLEIPATVIDAVFPHSDRNELLLDATPSYLYIPGAIAAMQRHNPAMKTIAIIRDPGIRAISHYYHSRWLGVEPKSLWAALAAEKKRLAPGGLSANRRARIHHSYVDRGRYRSQIDQLLFFFPDSLIIPFPSIITNPHEVLKNLMSYLDLKHFDLPIIAPQNGHGKRPGHRIEKGAISTLLRSDTRAVERRLGWKNGALREETTE